MLRTLAIAAGLTAVFASQSAAQVVAQPSARPDNARSTTLAEVVVTAKAPKSNVFSRAWRMNEDRAQVLAMMDENRRLAAQLRGYDKQIVRLEKRLAVAKAHYDQEAASVATTDSMTADTRRRRAELEERLRRLEGGTVAAVPGGLQLAFPADER
jgi:hypothetical protein